MNDPNTNLFANDCVSSNRIIYTPSLFARTSLLYLQETGTLQVITPHVSSRSNLSSYLLLVILSGSGWVEYEGKRYELKKGDIALIDCKKGYSQSSSEELWSAKWCHWNGGNMPALYNKIRERGLKVVFHPEDISVYVDILEELYETANGSSFVRDALINEILTRLITELMKETVYEEGEQPVLISTGSNTAAINIGEIKSYIDTHYQESLSLEGLADRFYFSKHYLARSFKSTFGMSVGSYITLVRVGSAKMMLRFSDMSIEEVGLECGYSDSSYFARAFKKVEGVSPSDFRRNWMSGSEKNTDTEQ